MANYRGRKHIDPYVTHEQDKTHYIDEFYEMTIEYIGEGTNTDDDRLRAAAQRTVAALKTPGRRRDFNNWYSSFLKRNPL